MEIANVMSERPVPFVPPAPRPREKPVGRFEMMRVVYKNPLFVSACCAPCCATAC